MLDEVIRWTSQNLSSLIIPIDFHDVIEIKEIDNDKDIITLLTQQISQITSHGL